MTAGRTVGSGLGMAGGEAGLVHGSAFTSSQSALSKRAAPPEPKAGEMYVLAAVLLFAVSLLVGYGAEHVAVGVVVGLALVAFCFWQKAEGPDAFNRDEYPDLFEHWRRTFMCMRCGESFEVSPEHLHG